MFETETIGNATLYRADCLAVLPTLGVVDAVVTDPPYGLNEAAKTDKARDRASTKTRLGTKQPFKEFGTSNWDKEPANDWHIAAMRRSSAHQIIFGGNHMELPPATCWLIWDKENSGDFADAEMAWTNLPKAVRLIRYMWNGMIRRERDVEREHPTQKPIEVMRWCISHLPDDVETICDPFMGSGTTGVAAITLGKKFIGIEIDKRYFDVACRRIEEAQKQPDLLVSAEL